MQNGDVKYIWFPSKLCILKLITIYFWLKNADLKNSNFLKKTAANSLALSFLKLYLLMLSENVKYQNL